MKVLVDTAVWSLALRRRGRGGNDAVVSELASLVQDGRVVMIGPVRQELLSGIRERSHFESLREHLRAFPDSDITSADYEEAAAFFNRCREQGIQGSNTDFLICAVAARNELSIFTTDEDFVRFATVLPIVLHDRRA
jgi:predicted nucleic acid-binding protein